MTQGMPVVTVTIAGEDRSGKSTLASIIATTLERLNVEYSFEIQHNGKPIPKGIAKADLVSLFDAIEPDRQRVKIVEVVK